MSTSSSGSGQVGGASGAAASWTGGSSAGGGNLSTTGATSRRAVLAAAAMVATYVLGGVTWPWNSSTPVDEASQAIADYERAVKMAKETLLKRLAKAGALDETLKERFMNGDGVALQIDFSVNQLSSDPVVSEPISRKPVR